MSLDKDYVWECDYGLRKPLISVLIKLLKEQDVSSLQMVSLFVNNVPYNLELYIVISYKNPIDDHIKTMLDELPKLKIKYRTDITLSELIKELANRRFNSATIGSWEEVDYIFNSGLFRFVEKEELHAKGYITKPLGKRTPVFISHSTNDKPEIEKLLPYLSGAGLPVWFDKISIDYGESITEAIEKGINESGAVIFWITRNFINSSWCKTERRSFSSRHSSYNDVLIISVISDDIDIRTEIPTLLRDFKAFIRKEDEDLNNIAKEIIPSLKKYLENVKPRG